MYIVERYNAGIRPEHRMIAKLVRPCWILWICFGHKRHIVGLCVRPALFERAMPKWKVLQSEDFPSTLLLNVLVFIYASFPPLYQSTRVRILDALVRARGHHATKASFGSDATGINVYDALDLRMIKQETMHGSIATLHKVLCKAPDVQSLNALFAIVAATKELDAGIGVVGKKVSNLVKLGRLQQL